MPPRERSRLRLKDLVIDSDVRATSMTLPVAVQLKLDEMVEAARKTKTSRNELLAVLVAHATTNASELSEQVMAYRDMTVGEVVDGTAAIDGEVVVPLRGPGRPKSKK